MRAQQENARVNAAKDPCARRAHAVLAQRHAFWAQSEGYDNLNGDDDVSQTD